MIVSKAEVEATTDLGGGGETTSNFATAPSFLVTERLEEVFLLVSACGPYEI